MRRFLAGLFLLLAASSAAFAIDLPQLAQFTNSNWLLAGAPALDANFAAGLYWGTSPTQLNTTRASAESEVCNGVLTTVPVNVPAIAPGCGLWDWEARTNSIRNNTMVGAVAGTPGTLPTNWTLGVASGLSVSESLSTINGMSAITFTFTGTTNASSQNITLAFDSNTAVPAAYGQTWSASLYAAQTGASNASTTQFNINQYSSGAFVISDIQTITPTANMAQYLDSATITNATITSIKSILYYGYPTLGTVVNFSVTIAVPQLELNPNLPATVASAATASSGTGGVNGTAVYTVTGGTCTTQPTLNVTWTAGALTVNSVANAGSCSVLPPSPATLAYASGTATGWTGATVTLTPTDNSASAFATGPILTTGTAATRAQPVIYAKLNSGPAYSLAAQGTPMAPNVANQNIAGWSDGTFNNRLTMLRSASGPTFTVDAFVAGSSAYAQNAGTWTQGSPGKIGASVRSGAYLASYNNTSMTSGSALPVPAVSQLHIGDQGAGTAPFNGVISRVTAWTYPLSQSQLNAATH